MPKINIEGESYDRPTLVYMKLVDQKDVVEVIKSLGDLSLANDIPDTTSEGSKFHLQILEYKNG